MQRKPKSELAEVAPSVPFVVLSSLFGFPGAGHIMVGRKALGLAFLGVFALGLMGMVYDLSSTLPNFLEKAMGALKEGRLELPGVDAPLRAIGWIALSGTAWALSGLHAGWLAYRQARSRRPSDLAAVLGG